MFGFLKFWRKPPQVPDGYRVFTDRFDREIAAADLILEVHPPHQDRGELGRLRQVLKQPSESRAKGLPRAMSFQSRWRSGHDLGERPVVTILIDHSGSMKGENASAAAISADIVASSLEVENIVVEVLGFTTSSWRGGKSRYAWETDHLPFGRGEQPKYPGRLCDLLHIVHRDGAAADPDWSFGLVTLLSDAVLKENVDGEAIQWAHRRAQLLSPTTWVCLLISDGAPVDDSTIAANGNWKSNWYLARHLNAVIDEINRSSDVRLGCLGLKGHTPTDRFKITERNDEAMNAPIQTFDLLEKLVWSEPEPSAEPRTS